MKKKILIIFLVLIFAVVSLQAERIVTMAPALTEIVFALGKGDEIVGYLITMIAAPTGWQWVVAGFVLFRIFDILKPWPIGWVDRRVHGGLGIMLDDVLAGIYAALVLQMLLLISVWFVS